MLLISYKPCSTLLEQNLLYKVSRILDLLKKVIDSRHDIYLYLLSFICDTKGPRALMLSHYDTVLALGNY